MQMTSDPVYSGFCQRRVCVCCQNNDAAGLSGPIPPPMHMLAARDCQPGHWFDLNLAPQSSARPANGAPS